MKKLFSVLCAGVILAAGTGMAPVAAAAAGGDTITVDVNDKMQTWDGFGTALAWWANMYGGLKNIVDGQEQRKNITDMIFTEKGLNLNIARYNLGTYENPQNTSWDKVLNMPPLVVDPGADWQAGDSLEYNLDNDPNQRWVLEEFLRVQPEGITELWVNTPPYFMTVSGSAAGPLIKGTDNIAPEMYGAYASYLVDILELFDDEGIRFDYIEPFNEPNSGYTNYFGPHSGNHVNFGAGESGIINTLYNEMRTRGIEGKYPIAATDELNTSQTAIAWGMLDDTAKENVSKINTHTYSGTREQTSLRNLKKAAYGESPDYANPKKKLWMSERTLHMGPEPESFYYGIALAQEIIDCINVMGANAWCHWQASDELGVNTNSTLWRYDMQFFTFGNFTRYITPGSTIINTNDSSAVAALTPDNQLVLVTTTGLDEKNPNSALNHETRNLTVNVKGAGVSSVSMVQTTAMSTEWEVEKIEGAGKKLSVTLPEVSVTTFLFDLNESGGGCSGSVDSVLLPFALIGTAAAGGVLFTVAKKRKKSSINRGEKL